MSHRETKELRNEANRPILTELNQMYRVQSSRGSKFAYVIKKAIASLRKYPLEIVSGKQSLELSGVGPAIAHRIEKVCMKLRQSPGNGQKASALVTNVPCGEETNIDNCSCNASQENADEPTSSSARKRPKYVPTPQSAPWFVIISFHLSRSKPEIAQTIADMQIPYPTLNIPSILKASHVLVRFTSKGTLPRISVSTVNALVKRGAIVKVQKKKSDAIMHRKKRRKNDDHENDSNQGFYALTQYGKDLASFMVLDPSTTLAIANARASIFGTLISRQSEHGRKLSNTDHSGLGDAPDLCSPISAGAAASAQYRPRKGTEAYAFIKCISDAAQIQGLSKRDILRHAAYSMDGRFVDPVGSEVRMADGSFRTSGWKVMTSTKGRGGLIHRGYCKMLKHRGKNAENSKTYALTQSGVALARIIGADSISAISYSDSEMHRYESDTDEEETQVKFESICQDDQLEAVDSDVIDLSQHNTDDSDEDMLNESSSMQKRPLFGSETAQSDGDNSVDSDDEILLMQVPLSSRVGISDACHDKSKVAGIIGEKNTNNHGRKPLANDLRETHGHPATGSSSERSVPQKQIGSESSKMRNVTMNRKRKRNGHGKNEMEKENDKIVPLLPIGKHDGNLTAPLWNDAMKSSLSPHEWEVVLLLDNREHRTQVDRTYFQDRMLECGVLCEIRNLPLGDVMWIVRRRVVGSVMARAKDEDELVLHYIVERKRIDDLAASLMDGRYKEQKFRLQRCGLKNLIYLIEGDASRQDTMPAKSLETAIIETEVQQGFRTQKTKHAGETIDFLCALHHQIVSFLLTGTGSAKARHYVSTMDLKLFRKITGKVTRASTAQDVFGCMLRQLPRCGGAQANAVLLKYPTVNHLLEAYRDAKTEREAMALLENLRPHGRARLGPALSRMAYFLFYGKAYADT